MKRREYLEATKGDAEKQAGSRSGRPLNALAEQVYEATAGAHHHRWALILSVIASQLLTATARAQEPISTQGATPATRSAAIAPAKSGNPASPDTLATPADSAARAPSPDSAARPASPESAAALPTHRVTLFADLFARGNPEGVMAFVGGLWRKGFDLGASDLLRGLYVSAGVSSGVNPAYAQFNGFLESVPVALLQLRLQMDGFRYFGANGALLAFPSDESKFGRRELNAISGSELSGTGYRILMSPTLRLRIGDFIVRSQTDVSHFRVASQDGTYFEWEYDTLVHERDWVVANRTAVLAVLSQGRGEEILVVGPVYEVTRAVGTAVTRHRGGAVLFWVPRERWGAFARPRLFSYVGLNVADRNRQWQPFGILGLGMDWDIWTDAM